MQVLRAFISCLLVGGRPVAGGGRRFAGALTLFITQALE
jgi:hypothetical protein